MTVSDETLLVDIANSRIETNCYNSIGEAFLTLSTLPENDYKTKNVFIERSRQYFAVGNDCRMFLDQLLDLARERGLNV